MVLSSESSDMRGEKIFINIMFGITVSFCSYSHPQILDCLVVSSPIFAARLALFLLTGCSRHRSLVGPNQIVNMGGRR